MPAILHCRFAGHVLLPASWTGGYHAARRDGDAAQCASRAQARAKDCKACLQGAVLKQILHSLTYDGPGTWTLRDLAEAVAPEG